MAYNEQGVAEIRPARPHDVDALTELGVEIHQLHAEGRPDVFRAPDSAALREFFESQFAPDKHVLIDGGEGRPTKDMVVTIGLQAER